MSTWKTTISTKDQLRGQLRGLLGMVLVALCTTAGTSVSQAATPTTRAVHAFLQGGEIDPQLEDQSPPDRDLRVNVWHDREDDDTYQRGEAINVHFRTNADMYVTVYRLDTDGKVEILWPTTRYDDGFVYGNHTYTLPRPGSPVRLRASQLRGVEYIEAIASEYPFDLRNLAIDFRFDPDSRGDYDYEVSGDPFLAVNDINFAITGLESDVDYVVTDWAHLYVDSKVEYARYACRQCHDQSDTDYHPYVDHCTTVNIYNDWGWQRSWYSSFGWYPLYYEPPYYYWDIAGSRPYWYPYYPLVYSWPTFGVYVRPYPVYWWYDSPYSWVDYSVRYKKNWRHYRPLYDLDSPRVRGAARDIASTRAVNRSPASMRESLRGRRTRDGVESDRLVQNRMPERRHRGEVGPTVTTRRSGPRITDRNDPSRSGVRTDLSRRSEARRLRSLPSARSEVREGTREQRGERQWTRPVIRNRDESMRRPPARARQDRQAPARRSSPEAKPERRGDRRSGEAKRERSSTKDRSRSVQPPRQNRTPPREKKVTPPTRRGGERGNTERKVAPPSSRRTPSKSSPPSRGSKSGGSRSRGGDRRGGRG